MQVKTTQKISRSAVATVLATSSVALGLPAQSNAAAFFSDVKPADFFYSAVNELAEKKIVNGYGDGTFRPYNNVTRGEAAKMLALSLKLDVDNAETTQFTDVKKGDIFYKYIAALANKGIVSGYPDGSFKPNEVVQRGSMAKMVALGYQFVLATNITHPFKDVDQNYIFNQHIQTLVNLNITKGTSFNTFEPGKAVTRGELATFISRASKADAGKPAYIIDNVIGDKIYINSVGYTIGANVASYIKAENKSALIGGHIEGTFNGMTLTNVTKLTLNATGSANSIYTFDGGNSTFNGTLVVNGSYLKFKNWTLNGQTVVSETPRKSLAQYTKLSQIKFASLASDFIDFTRPTNPDDGILNNGENSGSLNPGKGTTSPYAPYSEKLTQIHKYVDFTNVTVKNLFVEQNRTYVAAQKEIAMVTIRRDVEFAELNLNIRNLYLEGDESLVLYGTHDIATVYKNSYYSVYFNSDSHINTLIVDNSNGWINLGDFVTVDKAIIPPKTTPNDIFDDYRNDNDKIGKIEDNTGGGVDRNPIENGVVPDVTKPIVHSLTVDADSNQATASLTVNETGKYHYVVLPENAPAPTVREIVSAQSGLSGRGTVTESEMTPDGLFTTTFVVKGLESLMKYTMYVVHVDDAGNFSARQERDFETKDGTPPQFMAATAVGMPGGRRIQFDFKPSETGKYYYFVREAQNVDNTITVDNVITGAQDSGDVTAQMVANGHTIVIREDENGYRIKPLTKYVVYSVLVDDSGNKIIQANMFKSPVTTSVLDETPPFVTGKTADDKQRLELVPTTNGTTQFYMYFSEKLDKASAENINNYLLSGTGIINVPGQAPITPSKVVYEEASNRVLITIPSLTGFVHGDTLRVTVSKEVKDLAENDFENASNAPSGVTPRNFAEYEHDDKYYPNLSITKVDRDDPAFKAKIYYNATKAGTLYYLIASEKHDTKIMGMKPEDFVAEFGQRPTTEFNESGGGKIYLEGNTPASLKAPITAEIGDSEFIYDYSTLSPSSFESYKIYMVLKDRSGRLSPIRGETIISDKEAPQISSFDVKSKENDDTKAMVTITSDEGGTAYFGYAEKYVQDPSTGKFVLNPLIYDGTQLKQFGMNPQYTDAQNRADFLSKVPNVRDRVMVKGSLNNYEVTGLKPYTEYVFYYAVQDAFGNFTVKTTTPSQQMVKELYTDGTKPHVINDYVVKDPFGNFVLTFNETLGKVYEHSGVPKDNLNQKTTITSTTNLADIIEIKKADGSIATGDFILDSYTVATTNPADKNPPSKLVIKPAPGKTINYDFVVNVKKLDQSINNYGNKAIDDKIHYKYPTAMSKNKFVSAKLVEDNESLINRDKTMSTLINVVPALNVEIAWNPYYYYLVLNNTITVDDTVPLDVNIAKLVIDNANANPNGNTANNVPIQNVVSYGRGKLVNTNDYTSVKQIRAMQYPANSSNNLTSLNVFLENSRFYLFTVDQYGNIIWAKDDNGNYNIKIQGK